MLNKKRRRLALALALLAPAASPMRKISFQMYVAGPAVAAAYREASERR